MNSSDEKTTINVTAESLINLLHDGLNRHDRNLEEVFCKLDTLQKDMQTKHLNLVHNIYKGIGTSVIASGSMLMFLYTVLK